MTHTVALVIGELEVGGTQRQIFELAKGLDREIFSPHVICLSTSLAFAPAIENAGIPLTVVPKTSKYDWTSILRLRRVFQSLKVQSVITYGFTADAWARVAARTARIPVVISSVRTSNEDLRIIHFVNRMLRPLTDHYIANSMAVAGYLRNTVGVTDEKISVIHNGIDLSRFESQEAQQRKALNFFDDSEAIFLIGAVCRLSPEKNVEGLLRIAKIISPQIPSARFLIVGEGPDAGRLRSLVYRWDLSSTVKFIGERNDIPEILSTLDVAILTSFREGLSNTLLEYMAAGLPIVASKVGGNQELIQNEQTGLLYPVNDDAAATQHLLRLFGDFGLRARLGAAAKRVASNNYSISAMVSQTQQLLCYLRKGREIQS